MRSEDQLFDKVRASLHDYSPEVPASVYSGMRRKLWWSNFMRFQAHRLNAWYVLLLVGAGAGVWSAGSSPEHQSVAPQTIIAAPAATVSQKAETSIIPVNTTEETTTCTQHESVACCSSAKQPRATDAVATAEPAVNTDASVNVLTTEQTATRVEPAHIEETPAPAATEILTEKPEENAAAPAPAPKAKKGRGMKVTVYEKKN